ncbi:MAG: hypothetical protein GEV13_32450 [Rhodospirillales bacterium]|nr:hypothetical protein [Rhodospirillales bacterium]
MAVADPLLGHGRQIIVREDWLRLTEEPILEPGLPIIDPHHHLWPRAEGSTAGAAGGHRQWARHPRHHLRAVRRDVSRGRTGRGVVARRNRVCHRRGRDQRQRPSRPDAWST